MTFQPSTWLARLEQAGGARYIRAMRHGSMELELYAPRGVDLQQPHARDELYFVVTGQGQFECDGQVTPFAAGDALFVPAFAAHRFFDFSADFATWVVFYGPTGGEAA